MAKATQTKGELVRISPADIAPNVSNPRAINKKSDGYRELCDSIRASGVRVPLQVRLSPNGKAQTYELLAGSRRLQACLDLKLEQVSAINYGKLNDDEAFEITFVENFAREDLTPFEQGKAVSILLDKHKGDAKAVAAKMGKSVKWVLRRQALDKNLSRKWKAAIEMYASLQLWTAAHLQLIASLPVSVQDEMLECFDYEYVAIEELPTVKQIEEIVNSKLRLLRLATFPLDKKVGKVGPCSQCKKRSSATPGLFDDVTDEATAKKEDKCLDETCFARKKVEWAKALLQQARAKHPKVVLVGDTSAEWQDKRDLREEFGDEVSFNWKPSTENAKKSVPAFVLSGKDAGKVKHVELLSSESRASSRVSSAKKATGKPKPLKERRELLENKRNTALLPKIQNALSGKHASDLVGKNRVETIMALAEVFGVKEPFNGITAYHFNIYGKEPWKAFSTIVKKQPLDVYESLWQSVKAVLVVSLEYQGPKTGIEKERVKHAHKVAELVGIDVAALKKEVDAEIPEPRAWAKLNEDGTPKTPLIKTEAKKKAKATNKKSTKPKTAKKTTKDKNARKAKPKGK